MDEIIATNLTGTYNLVGECLKGPGIAKGGHILLISSILARLGVPGYTAYCASKSGLLGLMRSWASELAGDSIFVNALCPGWVNTEMAREGIRQFAENDGISFDEALKIQMGMVPMGKMSEPKEVANFIAFLLSDKQKSFTGQTFDMNNGAMMP